MMSAAPAVDLWDLAKQRSEATDGSKCIEHSLLVIGSKHCGKTTLINRLIDRDEAPKGTVALEYKFCRKSTGPQSAELGHIWELGSGTWLSRLIDFPLSADVVNSFGLVLFIDLSKPHEMWHTVEKLLYQTTVRLKQIFNDATDPALETAVRNRQWQLIGEDHPDRAKMKPLGVPLAIVGGKYDEFQALDTKSKEVISKTLRWMAHTYGGSLHFFSCKNESLVKHCKSVLSSLLFGAQQSTLTQLDSSKPLSVPCGLDLFAEISAPPYEDAVNTSKPIEERWKAALSKQFPQKDTPSDVMKDPMLEPDFAERPVDALRAIKNDELEQYRKLAERRQRELEQTADLDSVVY